MAARFTNIYHIRTGATFEAIQDNEASATYSGSSLVTDVLNAIETAHPTGGFLLLFGFGVFDMGTENWTLNTMNDMSFIGADREGTEIRNSSDGGDSEPFSFTNANRARIAHMSIRAAGAVNTTSDALDFDNSSDCRVEDVAVLDSRGRGIVFDGKDSGAAANGNIVKDVDIVQTRGGTSQAGAGIQILGGQDNEIHNPRIRSGVSGPGVTFRKASSGAGQPNKPSSRNKLFGGLIDGAQIGVEMLSSGLCLIQGTTIRNCVGDGISFAEGDSIAHAGNRVHGATVYDNGGYGIDIASLGTDHRVTDSHFDGNTSGQVRDLGSRNRFRGNIGIPDNMVLETGAAYTLEPDEPVSTVNLTATATVTLPDNADAKGRVFLIMVEAGTGTVARAGSDTIDGGTSLTVSTDARVGVASTGDGDWKVVSTEGTVT